MIKIIRNTMIDPIKTTCKECGSIFTFNYQDIKREESISIFNTTYINRYIICPVCKCNHTLTLHKKEESEVNNG